jgi:hypothetical protein
MKLIDIHGETARIECSISELEDIILGLNCSLNELREGKALVTAAVQSEEEIKRLMKSMGAAVKRLRRNPDNSSA